jgi:large subunit ribosomal protein L31
LTTIANIEGVVHMKPGIHPAYAKVVFQDATTGRRFLTRSTATSGRTVLWEDGNEYPLIVADVTSDSHPFWTGTHRVVDSQGRVEKFERKYGRRERKVR